MDKQENYQYKIDELDYKIVRLFEQRMCVMKELAKYHKKHDLEPRRKRRKEPLPIVQKTTETACDTEVIAYTEGLMMFMLTAGENFYRKCLKNKGFN